MKMRKKKIYPIKIMAHTILGAGCIAMAYPIVFIILVSFFSPEEFNKTVISLFPIAKDPTWDNIKSLLVVTTDAQTLTYYINSILRTLYNTFFSLLTSLLGGYVFARLRFKGKELLFMVLLATMMIPGIVSTMPMYLELRMLGLYNTWGAYLLVGGGAINVMGAFLVRQTIEGMPNSLEEAARIDGANTFQIIFRIVMPMVKTVLVYIGITGAIGVWNDWSTPFYYTDSSKLQTIASALTKLTAFASKEGELMNYPAIMTFSLMLTIPSVIIFFIFQKQIVEGLMSAGIKG